MKNIEKKTYYTELKLAIELISNGRHNEVIGITTGALAKRPDSYDLWLLQAIASSEISNFQLAESSANKAIELEPNDVSGWETLSNCYLLQKKWAESIEPLNQAIKITQKGRIDLLIKRGKSFAELQKFDEAALDFYAAIEINQKMPEVHKSLAIIEIARKKMAKALSCINLAIEIEPNDPKSYGIQGRIYGHLSQSDLANASFEKAFLIDPTDLETINHFAQYLQNEKRHEEAISLYQKIIAVDPSIPEVYSNFSISLMSMSLYEEAIQQLKTALEINPKYFEAHNNIAGCYQSLNLINLAMEHFVIAAELAPDNPHPRWNLSLQMLLLGHLKEGFIGYENRLKLNAFPTNNFLNKPIWEGQRLTSKTLLIDCEQGLGDSIQFSRYLKLVAAKENPKKIIFRVQLPVLSLLKQLEKDHEGQIEVQGHTYTPPSYDYYTKLLSLPRTLGTNLNNIPSNTPYLLPDKFRSAFWNKKLNLNKKNIGLVWAGNKNHTNDQRRSMSLENLEPLLTLNYQYLSLQKEVSSKDAELLDQYKVLNMASELKNFTETASIIDNLDAVVTVDTSVAHLAAAMHKPTYLLIAIAPDWRWMLDRSDSPWYPSIRLFRQEKFNDWSHPVNQLKQMLLTNE